MDRISWICLLGLVAFAQSQTDATPTGPLRHLSVADFGLSYPLPEDWIRATELVRKRMESGASPQNSDLLLAAVYVPKWNLSATNPFFSLVAYRQSATDCKKSLEAMIARSQDEKIKKSGVTDFTAAGRDYFRVNIDHGFSGRHQSMICTAANSHLLVWNAGAPDEKGLDAILATLESVTTVPPQASTQMTESTPVTGDGAQPGSPKTATPERVRVSSGVTTGLLIKRVNPVYPDEARRNYIQGTVILQAEISKAGDITDLELVSGPIELAGSAVYAVRQWKYRPYLLLGQPVIVNTQIQVNYALSPR